MEWIDIHFLRLHIWLAVAIVHGLHDRLSHGDHRTADWAGNENLCRGMEGSKGLINPAEDRLSCMLLAVGSFHPKNSGSVVTPIENYFPVESSH